MNTTPTARTGQTVSEQTGNFIQAIRAFEVVKDSYLKALCGLYGEQRGNDVYQSNCDEMDALEGVLYDGLRCSIVDTIHAGITDKI